MPLEIGRFYIIGLLHPDPTNAPSPVDYVHQADGLHEIPAVQSRRRPQNIRTHIGVVARYDDVEGTAVVFLGSSNPRQTHRFVPYWGTPRKQGQPFTPLTPAPQDAFVDYPGFLCFSHAIKIKVMREGDIFSPTVPATVLLRQSTMSGVHLDVVLPPPSQSYLQELHCDYWQGKRFAERDGPIPGEPGEPGGPGPDATSRALSGTSQQERTRSQATSSRGITIDTRTGRTTASIVAQIAMEEDERATQLELLETDGKEHPPKAMGIFLPCSVQALATDPGEDEGGLLFSPTA